MRSPFTLLLALLILLLSGLPADAAQLIRLGHAQVSEEPLWLMGTPGGTTPNKGKAYDLQLNMFTSSADRTKAFEGGALDCETINASGVILLASSGMNDISAVATISREHAGDALSTYMVRDDGSVKTIADLKGKIIGINGYRNLVELWDRLALMKAGLNPDRDVKFTLIPLPQGPDALRQKLVDEVMVDGTTEKAEIKKGGIKKLFTSLDISPGDKDLNVILCKKDFLKANGPAVRAFLADYVATLRSYQANRRRAYEVLAKANYMVPVASDVELPLDYARPKDGRVNPASWTTLQDAMIKAGFIQHGVDINSLIDNSYLPTSR